MAVFESIRRFFTPGEAAEPERTVPAPATAYEIRPLTDKHLKEVLQLNLRCFSKGENYTKHTFAYLLSEPRTLSYQMTTPAGEMVGFIFVMTDKSGAGHITTIGIAPEHRRRGLALRLLVHAEEALRRRRVGTVMLEVRVSNLAAQNLYERLGYSSVQRLTRYYNNGEDGLLMMKPLL